jgi:hypothetical protein
MTEPTPAETAAATAKEAEEQAALPYKWTQTIAELNVTFDVPGNLKSRDLVITIKKMSLQAGIKGQDPIIQVYTQLPAPVNPTNHPRAIFLTPSTLMIPPGLSAPTQMAPRPSRSISTRSTRWNGGLTLSLLPPRSM